MKEKIYFLSFLFLFPFGIFAQVPALDNLEMWYNQGHYKHTLRKSEQLLAQPEYDFSYLPRYYRAMSQFQLAQKEKWRRKHKRALNDAVKTIQSMQQVIDGKKVLTAHQYEISALKKDLSLWLYQLHDEGKKELLHKVKDIITTLFGEVPDVTKFRNDFVALNSENSGVKKNQRENKDKARQTSKTKEDKKETSASSTPNKKLKTEHEEVVNYAQTLLGVPYKWGGETPKGFDCSGFTDYVLKNAVGIVLSRTARSQYKNAKHIKRKEAKPGDLVFFGKGSHITHVGIVYTTNFNSIQMIHASSSVGVSIVDIYQSSYWKKRIKGFGRYIKK